MTMPDQEQAEQFLAACVRALFRLAGPLLAIASLCAVIIGLAGYAVETRIAAAEYRLLQTANTANNLSLERFARIEERQARLEAKIEVWMADRTAR